MPPAVLLTTWSTPALFAPALNWAVVGQVGPVPAPILDLNSALTVDRYVVKMYVVPEPSERWTIVIGVDGRLTPGLSALISALFQAESLPRKMSARVWALRFRLVTPGTLKMTATAPRAVGTLRMVAVWVAGGEYGASVPAKSTVLATTSLMPCDEPVPV